MASPALRLPHVSPQRLARLRVLFALLQALSPALAARVAFWLFLRPARRALSDDDARVMAQARLHLLRSGNDQVQTYEWGAAERTVLIVHGWGSRAARFAPMVTVLLNRGWRVLCIDAPAHGRSPGRSSSLPQFVQAMGTVAGTLGPVQAVIGHSLGGLAITCYHRNGDISWLTSVHKVVLISMPSGAPFLIDSFIQMLRIRANTATKLLQRFTRRFGAEPVAYNAVPSAPALQLPVLMVHDREDDIVPHSHSMQLQSELAHAALLTTQGLGHSALTRDPATLDKIGEFLDAI